MRNRSDTLEPGSVLPRAAPSLIADQAYDAIRDSIERGRFGPGEQLIEARLAEELGVSRGSVREGLKRLLQDGLVVHRPHRGTFVRDLRPEDVVAMYDVRVALESVAVRLLAKQGEVPKHLESLVSRMKEAAARDDVPGLVELGFQFHRGLCEASDNPFLLEFFDMISTQVRLALQLDSIEYLRHSDLGDYVDAHNELLVVIEAGDEYAASAALERHVLDGVGDLLTRLAADDDEAVQDLKPKVLGPEDRAFPPAHR